MPWNRLRFSANGVCRPRQIRGPKITGQRATKGTVLTSQSLSPWCDCHRLGSTLASWCWQDINVGNPLWQRALWDLGHKLPNLWLGLLELLKTTCLFHPVLKQTENKNCLHSVHLSTCHFCVIKEMKETRIFVHFCFFYFSLYPTGTNISGSTVLDQFWNSKVVFRTIGSKRNKTKNKHKQTNTNKQTTALPGSKTYEKKRRKRQANKLKMHRLKCRSYIAQFLAEGTPWPTTCSVCNFQVNIQKRRADTKPRNIYNTASFSSVLHTTQTAAVPTGAAAVIGHSPKAKLAIDAVNTLLAHSKKAWLRLNLPSGIHPNTMAATEARKPTAMACACKEVL